MFDLDLLAHLAADTGARALASDAYLPDPSGFMTAGVNKALAYIEQGNLASACDILNEVIIEGDDEQKLEARALLARIA